MAAASLGITIARESGRSSSARLVGPLFGSMGTHDNDDSDGIVLVSFSIVSGVLTANGDGDSNFDDMSSSNNGTKINSLEVVFLRHGRRLMTRAACCLLVCKSCTTAFGRASC